MDDTIKIIEVAKGITDYGALAIMAAIYLLLSASMMMAIFKWFKDIIRQIISDNKEGLNGVLIETRKQNEMLEDLVEVLRPDTQLRIRNLSSLAFDLSVEQVCQLIKRVREENHIVDKEATAEKIRKALRVIHEDRNSKFDTFSFRGIKLSAYCSEEWIEKVAKVVEGEIYHSNGPNNGRAFTNVKLAYDDIKTDFYHRLIR